MDTSVKSLHFLNLHFFACYVNNFPNKSLHRFLRFFSGVPRLTPQTPEKSKQQKAGWRHSSIVQLALHLQLRLKTNMLNSTPAPSLTFTLYFISCLPTCSLMSRPEKQTERQTHLQAMGKESVAYFSGYTSYQHRSTLKPPTQYCECSPSAAKSDMTLRGMVTRLLGESFGSRIDVFPLHLPIWLYLV